ncbi:TIGR03986 family CRISPR-associated RAMP protein [Algoriphagus sp.]|uniref:TIGR03986 family type III CRISPR-associated RAMP protein n=1 Tax=Algoriphagus sp. TaxID=1872435 RepID=UPI00391B1943
MEKITSPYNFIPLSEKVITPYWGSAISHDKPFAYGESGVLNVEMTAHSPIYVRNGSIQDENNSDLSFNQFQGQYFVPGSSIKGMLRNFIEIMSFGRMEDKVNDVKYSVRDFNNNNIYDKSKISKEVQCGWLRSDGKNYYLIPCGRPGRISHKELDKISGPNKMSQYYQQKENLKSDKEKSAHAKYKAFPFKKDGHSFSYKDSDEPVDGIGREKYVFGETGKGKKGTIVFSGQPGIRKEQENQGKQYEFIFFNYGNPEISFPKDEEGNDHEVIKNFFFAYYDHDKGQQKDDWKERKEELKIGKTIPVFFRLKDENAIPSARNVKDIGLTLLFKITYAYSVKENIQHLQKEESKKPDLADCLFGYIKKLEDKQYESLKGRIFISHAFASSAAKTLEEKKEVLGGPKASYYPNYIRQPDLKAGKIKGNYLTFNDNKAVIRGWKKYPVRHIGVSVNPPPVINGKINEKVATKFIPLDKGAKFQFQIAYHNLRREELGALISALTFHGHKGLFHSIGMGKPLGYGKIDFSLEGINSHDQESLMKEFESYMNYELSGDKNNWAESSQIIELFTIANPSDMGDEFLKYQKMDMRNSNEFQEAKKEKLALLDYSSVVGPLSIQSKVNIQEIEKAKTFHRNQAAYLNSLSNQANNNPTTSFKLLSENQINEAVQSKKVELIQKLKATQIRLKEEKAQQAALKNQKLDQERLEGKLSNPINLESVKVNARGFESLEKVMKGFQVKFKDGPLKEKTDIEPLVEKLKEIYAALPEKEKTKWRDTNWEANHYYKKIVKWLGEDLTKKIIQNS